MASDSEVNILFTGVAAGDPFSAFGLSWHLPPAQLRRECGNIQALFHSDKGNTTYLSQFANACASVICWMHLHINNCLMNAAKDILRETKFKERLKEWAERHNNDHYERATSQ